MDIDTINKHLLEGKIDEGAIFPYLFRLEQSPFVFDIDFGLNLNLSKTYTFTVNILEIGDTEDDDTIFIDENLKITFNLITNELMVYKDDNLYLELFKSNYEVIQIILELCKSNYVSMYNDLELFKSNYEVI